MRRRRKQQNGKRIQRLGWRADVVVFPSKMEILAILLFNLDFSMSALAIASIRACGLCVAFDSHLPMESEWVCVCQGSSIHSANDILSRSLSEAYIDSRHTPNDDKAWSVHMCAFRRFMLSGAHRMRNRKEKWNFSAAPTLWLYLLWARQKFHMYSHIVYMRFDFPVGFPRHVHRSRKGALCGGSTFEKVNGNSLTKRGDACEPKGVEKFSHKFCLAFDGRAISGENRWNACQWNDFREDSFYRYVIDDISILRRNKKRKIYLMLTVCWGVNQLIG